MVWGISFHWEGTSKSAWKVANYSLQSYYQMVFYPTEYPRLIFGRDFFNTNPAQICYLSQIFVLEKSLRDARRFAYLHIDGIFSIFTHLWNIYTSVEYLHRCRSYTTQPYVINTYYRCVVLNHTCVNIPHLCKYSTECEYPQMCCYSYIQHTLKELLVRHISPPSTRGI